MGIPWKKLVGVYKEGLKEQVETVIVRRDVTELHWEIALHEFGGPRRRPGLWSKVFAQAQGNEEIAKANYLNARVLELLVPEEFGNAQIAMWLDKQETLPPAA